MASMQYDEDDDIHTINSVSCQSNNERPFVSYGNGMIQNSPEVFQFASTGSGSNSRPVVYGGIPLSEERQITRPLHQSNASHPVLPVAPIPAVECSNPEEGCIRLVHNDDESDVQSTTTIDYPQSMNSFYSHRDALSANGSYGADMSFVTTQTSIASPSQIQQRAEEDYMNSGIDSKRNSLSHMQYAVNQSSYRNHVAVTQSAIKAAMERGTNMAYDESSSVFGHSTVAHTIASSSNMTKENNYFFNSTFLRSHNYDDAHLMDAANEDHTPTALPHLPSLPNKGTDLTADSMFLGMEYDNDYIKTKLKVGDLSTTSYPLVSSSNIGSDEAMRQIHRKRVIYCVCMLIALIIIVGVGGIVCTFGMSCPGVEQLSSSRFYDSNSNSATAKNNEATLSLTPSPVIVQNNSGTVPTNESNAVSPPTGHPIKVTTSPPTKRPIAIVASPILSTAAPTRRPVAIVISPTLSPVDKVEDVESSPTKSPVPKPREIDNNDEESPPTKDTINDGGSTDDDKEQEEEPSDVPTQQPNTVDDAPTTTPSFAPILFDRPNNPEMMGDDEIPTESPTTEMMNGNNNNHVDDDDRNTENDDADNTDDRLRLHIK